MARLSILNDAEYNALYELPEFLIEDKLEGFSLDHDDYEILGSFDDVSLKINYILQLGYFKAVQFFFNFTFQKVREDVWYIINTYYPDEKFPKKNLSSYQHYRIQDKIREKYKITKSSVKFLNKLRATVEFLCKNDMTPRFLFEGILSFAQQNNVIRPAYSTCQEIISNILKKERIRLAGIISTKLNRNLKKQLDSLLEKEETLYNLTLLKKDPKDFSTGEIKKEVGKHDLLSKLYFQAQFIIPLLKISDNNIKFYSDMVEYYPIAKLKGSSEKNIGRLYLLCFVFNRFKQINDNLIQSGIYRTNKYTDEADEFQEKQIYDEKLRLNESQTKAGRILRLFINDKVPDDKLREKAFRIISRDKFSEFARKIICPRFDKNKYIWKYHQKNAKSFKLNLRPIFTAVKFLCKNPDLQKAVNFLKKTLDSKIDIGKINYKEIPVDFFPKSLRLYCFERHKIKDKYKRTFMWDRYEFSVYLKLKEALDAGEVFVKDSINYRCLEDELIQKDIWRHDKDKLLKKINSKLLLMNIDDILKKLKDDLNDAYRKVNRNILNGKNKHIKIVSENKKTGNVTWKLPYKKEDDGINNPFYEHIPTRDISNILHYVSERVDFMKHFIHILPRYSKTELNKDALFAASIAKATGLGIRKMAEICDVKLSDLEIVESSFLRLENLKKVNVELTDAMTTFPIFKYYTLSDYGIHASIDGQKFETKVHTIMARYSSKYFGFNKGVVAMSLLANNALINTKIIGANEYEGHYLFDMVYNNNTGIKISAVSGDMHSINKINFALLYLFGFRFMPRFTKLSKKTSKYLISFGKIDAGSKDFIKPCSTVNEKLIKNEWDNILRILASLAVKKTSQASMIRKLTSFDRNNSTHKALVELDKIVMSLYMLDYIDDHKTRKNVHRVLNRGESYHQLKSALIKIGSGKLPGKTSLELNISNECAAFLTSVIIYYNASILSLLLENYKNENDRKNIKLIMRLSPVAWRHINLLGIYEFYRNRQVVDIEDIIKSLLMNLKINSAI